MNNIKISTIFAGFPARSSRGYLGWSSVHLMQVKKETTWTNYLFDTGGFNEREILLEKLMDLNITPTDIHGVILSHLHFDHAVNWPLFPNAQIYINEKELQENQLDLAVPDFHKQELRKSPNLNLITEKSQIDGMKVIEAPGHTPGMIALDIDGKIFASDAIKNRSELTYGPLGQVWNLKEAEASIKKLCDLGHTLYPGHDVPLIKTDGKWVATVTADETLYLTQNLHDSQNRQIINLSIPCCQ